MDLMAAKKKTSGTWIPVFEPDIHGLDLALVQNALYEKQVSGHSPIVREFEQAFADWIGVRYAVAVSSGTAALETALHSVGVGEGDEVIMPSFTIISCAIAALRLGAVPVLVDVDAESWCINVKQAEAAITERTKAIMPVHMFGHPADMRPLWNLDVPVVEDAAQAHGADYTYTSVSKCGSMGDAAAFSFYANKLITTGEGGMVTTDSEEVAQRARAYRSLYFGEGVDKFYHTGIGYNFRMSAMQAALGLSQLQRADELLARKRRVAGWYRERLEDCDKVILQKEQPRERSACWMFGVVLIGKYADGLVLRLADRGIGARPFFWPLHMQPALYGKVDGQILFSNSSWLAARGILLPSSPNLTESQVDYIVECLLDVISD